MEALEKANNSNQNEVSSVRKQLTEAESQLGKVRSEMEQMKVQHRDSTSVSKAEQEKIAKAEADLA